MHAISIEGLKFGYTADTVLKDVNLSVEQGEIISIYGENGSGKSTLLKLILGELKPASGKILVLGKNISNIQKIREIGYVPQVLVVHQMAFPITVLELVVMNLYEDFGFIKIPRKRHKEQAIQFLKEMGLGAYIHVPLNELSGGLKQRAMIARAMINKPKILVLDEPTSGIDKQSKRSFLKLIGEMNEKHDIATVIVSHEMELVRQCLQVDRTYRMEDGGIWNVAV